MARVKLTCNVTLTTPVHMACSVALWDHSTGPSLVTTLNIAQQNPLADLHATKAILCTLWYSKCWR